MNFRCPQLWQVLLVGFVVCGSLTPATAETTDSLRSEGGLQAALEDAGESAQQDVDSSVSAAYVDTSHDTALGGTEASGRESACGCSPCRRNRRCCNCPSCCGGCAALADPNLRLFPQDAFIRIRGWLDAGYLGNTQAPPSGFNGPYNSQMVDYGQFSQAYFIMERPMELDSGLGIGGRWDMLYGADYLVAQSAGVEVTTDGNPRWNSNQYYGLAMPQAYAELGNTNLSVKVGHFYSIVGYEGVEAANNFFYSRCYSYQFAGPFTHWGALGSAKATDNLQLQFGVINGWNALNNTVNRPAYITGLKYTDPCQNWWSSFAIVTGDEQNNPGGQATVANNIANRTRYSWLVSRDLRRRTEYVFHHWLGLQATGFPISGATAMWYGIDQYLYYRVNSRWRLGSRIEWFRDDGGTRVGLNSASNPNKVPLPGSYASWTNGANWTPGRNLTIRPELRWDTFAGTGNPFNDGNSKYQLLLGVDAILQF